MSTSSNALKLTLLAAFCSYPLLLIHVIQLLQNDHIVSVSVTPQLVLWKMVFIGLSIYSMVAPWLIRKGFLPLHFRANSFWGQLQPKAAILVIGYLFVAAPVVYGLVLFFLGLAITETYYFAGASMLGALVWGIYNLKKS